MTTAPERPGPTTGHREEVPADAGVEEEADPGGTDGGPEEIRPRYVVWTTVVCLAFAAFGHVFLWAMYSSGSNEARQAEGLPPIGVWEPAVGVAIVGVALTAFGGFYAASLRARVAITASFLLTFLVMLSYALTLRGFASATVGDAAELMGDFRAVVITVIGFYFGSEAVVSAVKVYSVAKSSGSAGDVARADRDLPTARRGVRPR